jgi:hypothetical protein
MKFLDSDRIMYFELVREGFQRALESIGDRVERSYQIAGHHVLLSFAGSGLVDKLTRAFSHLETKMSDPPELTICLWDSESTQTPLPLLVSSLVDLVRLRWFERLDIRKEIKDYNDARIKTMFHLGPDILSLLDLDRNLALYWVESSARIPYYEEGYPLTPILSWWLENRGYQLLHAAGVGSSAGGVIVAGKGGSGKSTTALACLDSSLKFLGDDYCILETRESPQIHSLYSTAKLKGNEDLERFPRLKPLIANLERLGDEKALLFVKDHFPEKLVRQFPLRAVFVPRVTGNAETVVGEISAARTLRSLAPGTLFQLPGSGQSAFQAMSALVKLVPCRQLDLGREVSSIPRAIQEYLEKTA